MDSFDYKLIICLIIASSSLIGVFLMAIFPFILNKQFDPDWLHKQWTWIFHEGQPFFGVLRANTYAIAVASTWYARRVFRSDTNYDFRRQVSTGIRILCTIFCGCTLIGGVAALVALGEILGFYVYFGL